MTVIIKGLHTHLVYAYKEHAMLNLAAILTFWTQD